MNSSKIIVLFFAVLFIFSTINAFCAQGINAGPLKIKPSIEARVGSDNNVFLVPENEEQDDTYFSILPRVAFEMPYQNHFFSLDYGIEFRRYSEYDSENADLHNLEFQGLLNITSQLDIRILERYKQLSGDTTETIGRTEYSVNNAAITAVYQLNSKLSFEGQYGQAKYDYDDPSLIGRTENQVSLSAIYDIYDKWGFLGEFAHGEVDIDETGDDASYNRILVGARGSFTPKLSGLVKIGQEMRSYEGDREDTDLGFLAGEITHQVADDMKLTIGATQQLVESIVYSGNAYTETQFRAGLTKTFMERFSIMLSGYFQSNEYENPVIIDDTSRKREDDIWQAEIGVEYRLNRYTILLAGFEHKVFDSNFDENDFEVDRFNIGARLEY